MTVDVLIRIVALTNSIGQGKIPGELNPGLIVFFAICFILVIFFWVQHYRKNNKK